MPRKTTTKPKAKAKSKKAPVKKVPAKKAPAKKSPAKTSRGTQKTNSKRRGRNYKPDTGKLGGLEKDLYDTAEEVEEHLINIYKEASDNDFNDLPSPTEMRFCHEFLNNGFKKGPAIREIFPDLSSSNMIQRANDYLDRPRVMKYLSRELHNRRLKMGVTAEWICKKYLMWANLDITDFIEFSPATIKGRGAAVYLKKNISELPPLVRQSIKAITVDDKGKVKIEFVDQKSALDSLAKMLGYAQDKISFDGGVPINLYFDKQDEKA